MTGDRRRRPWTSVLDSGRRADAVAVAQEVALRCSDPARISRALAAAAEQTQYPASLRWEPHDLAGGDAGLGVMCSYLDACFPEAGWDVVGHGFVTAAARWAETSFPRSWGMFGGVSGLAFAVASLSRGGTRYAALLSRLDDALAPRALGVADALRRGGSELAVNEFDVIGGASGIGAYLLLRDPHAVLPAVLDGLVSLAEPCAGPPRWFTPVHLLGDDATMRLYPFGNLNCGLAHGIPGPLALLALALRAGVVVAGQAEAIRRIAEWLAEHRVDDEWGVNWPSAVPLTREGRAADLGGLAPTRSAWCYGSPGVARALWIAGEALDDDALRELAISAMLAVLRRPVPRRIIDSPTFCHGVSGLLQVVVRFADDTGLDAFRAGAAQLVEQLLDAYEPDRPVGYASLEPGPNPVDRVALLDGAAGVAMTLLAAATDAEPTWDRMFLLS